MENAVVLEILNSALVLLLLRVYLQNYREMKTVFGLGLIVFSFFLLLQNLISIYFHLMMIDYYSKEVMQHAFIITAAQTAALAVLAWVTYKE